MLTVRRTIIASVAVAIAGFGAYTGSQGRAWASDIDLSQARYRGAGTMTFAGRPGVPFVINFDRGLERREIEGSGTTKIFIKRPDRGVVYVVDRRAGTAIEKPLGTSLVAHPTDDFAAYDAAAVETETMLGEPVTKYRLQGEGAAGRRFDGFTWLTEDGIVVRLEGTVEGADAGGPMVIEVIRLERGAQEPHLFEPPNGITAETTGSPPGTPEKNVFHCESTHESALAVCRTSQ